jgi:hypothetical protein
MSLFSNLQRLYRPDRFLIEDFHTEIVAQVLRNSPTLTLQWLNRIGATTLQTTDIIDIRTQEEFLALPGHSAASRPDITIRLKRNDLSELIFIESKLPSTQGYDQLKRYAEQLEFNRRSKALSNAFLVFVTKDYESAAVELLSDSRFRLTRWYEFYHCMKVHVNGDGLATELKLFMEENHMSIGNQFRSVDLVALENFFGAKSLMDETLEGVVSDEMLRVFGNVYAAKKGMTYFRDHRRYVVSNGNWTDLECHIGYWLPHGNPDDPVQIGVLLYSKPGSPARRQVIEAFRGWMKDGRDGWLSDALDEEWAWSSIRKWKPLQSLMSGNDHVQTVKEYFLSLLKEVDSFPTNFSELPWTSNVPPISTNALDSVIDGAEEGH